MVYSIVFSPTGGTKKATDALTSVFGTVEELDLCKERDYSIYHFEARDMVFVSVPSYGGRVPAPAASRLLRLTGGGARTILHVVYGNRDYDDTLLELKELLESRGFSVFGAVSSIAEHSVVRQLASGRPDDADWKKLCDFGRELKEFFPKCIGKTPALSVKGNHPYKEYKGIPLKPSAGSGCNGCGVCASLCPAGAIPKENPKATKKESCISCMRCVSACPKKARKVNGLLLTVAAMGLKKKCAVRKEPELFLSKGI